MAWSVLLLRALSLVTESAYEENSRGLPRRGGWAPQRRNRPPDHCRSARARLGSESGSVPGPDGPAGCAAEADRDSDPTAVQHHTAEWLDFGGDAVAAGAAGDDSAVSWTDGAVAGRVLARESGGLIGFGDSALQPGDCGELGEGVPRQTVCHADYGSGGFSAAVLDRAGRPSNRGTVRDCWNGKGGGAGARVWARCCAYFCDVGNDSAAGFLCGGGG